MNRYYLLFLLFIYLFSCSSEPRKNEADILVENFLQIVGTTGYKTFSLRPSPSDSNNYLKPEFTNFEPYIIVTDSLLGWDKFQVGSIDISKFVSMSEIYDLKEYTQLIKGSKKFESLNNIAKFFPNKVDKYYLRFNLEGISSSGKITGNVKFSRVIIRNNIAAFLATISVGYKSGITKLFLLKKGKEKYEIMHEIDLVVW